MMWRTVSCCSAILAPLCLAAAAPGQDTATTEGLPARLEWVQFEVVLGRITALNPRYGGSRRNTSDDDATGVSQSMSISVHAGVPSIHYELLDPQRQLTVDLSDGNQLTIVVTPRDGSSAERLDFVQDAKGRVALSVESDGQQLKYSGSSLWHLLLAAPDPCRRHLLPILKFLRPNWHLAKQAENVERALFRAARSGQVSARERFRQLVAQLGDEDFQRRQAADRELRAFGQTVLTFLGDLDKRGLDAEQRLRIRRIRAALAVQEGDTSLRVAAWLIDDKSIWLTLMDHEDPSHRELAAKQLERLWGRVIDFDALAEPSERRAQIDRLRAQLSDG
jgi:hypothetical protein